MKVKIFLLFLVLHFGFLANAQDFIYGAKINGKSNSNSIFAHCSQSDDNGICNWFEIYTANVGLQPELYNTETLQLITDVPIGQVNDVLMMLSKISKESYEAFQEMLTRKNINKNITISNENFNRLVLGLRYDVDAYSLVRKWHKYEWRQYGIKFEINSEGRIAGKLTYKDNPYCVWEIESFEEIKGGTYRIGNCNKYSIFLSINFSRIRIDPLAFDNATGYYH